MLLPAITQTRGDFAPLLNKIHQCDALELLRRLPDASIDMVLCDLPYGVTACEWDTVIPIEPMWKELRRVVKKRSAIVLTATQPFTSRLVSSNYEMFRHEWIWDKNIATSPLTVSYKPMPRHESVLVFSIMRSYYYPQIEQKPDEWIRKATNAHFTNKHGDVYNKKLFTTGEQRMRDWKYPSSILKIQGIHPASLIETRFHPTQKPVALFEYLIKTYTQAGEIVLDMTCGSGTTAIAARKTGRQFICGDLSAEYVQVARQRLQNTDPYQATILPDGSKQLSLFEGLA